MENYEIILALILGAFVCLFGYKLKKLVFFIAWFLIGYTLMAKLMPLMISNLPFVAESELWQNLLPIAGGLLLSLLGFSIEKLCVALLCFFTVITIGVTQFGTGIETILISALIGVFAGALAVRMMKPAIILVTSFSGATVVADALLSLLTSLSYGTYYLPFLIGITVIGAIFQFCNTKHIA